MDNIGQIVAFFYRKSGRYSVTAWLICVVLFLCPIFSSAQDLEALSGDLNLNDNALARYEIEEISFVGNQHFSSNILANVINSHASDYSATRLVLQYYSREISRNPYTPHSIKNAFDRVQKKSTDERRYFDRTLAGNDTIAIDIFYNQNGFHQVSTSFDFGFNSITRRFTLTFTITENLPSKLDNMIFYGLENIPSEVSSKIVVQRNTLKLHGNFNQPAIASLNDNILKILRDNGYFFAGYQAPQVRINPEEHSDTVSVFFSTGKRQRIGSITFADSTQGQAGISEALHREQLELFENDWYSETNLLRTVNNLRGLGVFDNVSPRIDTLSDTTLSMHFTCHTRKMQEYTIDLGLKNSLNNLWKYGIEAGYVNKNFGGAAQNFNPFVQFNFHTISFNNWNPIVDQAEWKAGFRFSQSYLTKIFNQRVGLGAEVSYSDIRSVLYDTLTPLHLKTTQFRLSFPVTLPRYTLINSFLWDINLLNQTPENFLELKQEALSQAKNASDSSTTGRKLYQYDLLQHSPFSASTTFSFVGDQRDNPFTPSTGSFANFSVDLGLGKSPYVIGYMRIQGTATTYSPRGEKDVAAAKIKIGNIFWFDRTGTFIPTDKQFFAGGANSVRAWDTRSLRQIQLDTSKVDIRNFSDIIGSGSIIEGSVEYRWKIVEKPASESFWDMQISKIGFTGFLDAGNTFNSFLSGSDYNNITLNGVLSNLAIGGGIGFRYDTPVGPFRIDFSTKIYDPGSSVPWIFGRRFIISPLFSLGHAF